MSDNIKIKGLLRKRQVGSYSHTPRTEFYIKYRGKEYVIKKPGRGLLMPDRRLLQFENNKVEVEGPLISSTLTLNYKKIVSI